MSFPGIWRPKFQKCYPWCPTDSTNSKETQSLGNTAVEKSAWVKACNDTQIYQVLRHKFS